MVAEGLGDHYAEFPSHRPAIKPRAVGALVRTSVYKLSVTALIQVAVDKLAVEINAKRRLLADVERIRAEITTMENQRTTLQKMLAPVQRV